jgi:hypothetical protein
VARTLVLTSAVVAALIVSGCAKRKVIEFDHRFSINLVRVPDWYPGEKDALTLAEQEVLQRKGRPTFIRFWWNDSGDIIHSSDLSGQRDELPQRMTTTKRTWIYWSPREQIEYEFLANGGYVYHPVTERLGLICQYGDPGHKTVPKYDQAGRRGENWTWYDHGLVVELLDDNIMSRKNIQSTGAGTWLIK